MFLINLTSQDQLEPRKHETARLFAAHRVQNTDIFIFYFPQVIVQK